MDNLKHLYFFEESSNSTIRSRYSLGQVLYDLITVPEQVSEACKIARMAGFSNSYKPTFYVLKYISTVCKELPHVNPDDVANICGKLGSLLSQTRNGLPVVSIKIEQILKDTVSKIKRTSRFYSEHILENTKTENNFKVSICKMPDVGYVNETETT